MYSTSGHARSVLRSYLSIVLLLAVCLAAAPRPLQSAQTPARFSATDEQFLEDLEQRSFHYFWDQADARTGLVPDRARTDGSPLDQNHQNVGSIAATGFGLTALCIAAERHWVTPAESRERARNTLRFFAHNAFQKHGWFYHWLDTRTGERRWNSEVSSIDTALLLGGVLTARQYFRDDREINELATLIYERVDFRWMLNGEAASFPRLETRNRLS
jgi:hypothetical protein